MSNVYSSHVWDPTTNQWAVVGGEGSQPSYDDLADKPVLNAVGKTPETFINLAGLEAGHYTLSGYFKYDGSSDVDHSAIPLDVLVTVDETTGQKVITFPTVENGTYITNIVTYENNVAVSHVKQSPGVNYWKTFE